MANLSDWADGTRRERGQIILVTGFALAVSFVALALVLNSVIYTENLATRSEAAKASDAVKVKADMADATAEVIRYVNEYDASGGTSYADLYEQVELGVNNTTQYAQGFQIRNGQAVTATLVASDRGTWINQSYDDPDAKDNKNFTDRDGNPDWTLVSNAVGIRNIRLNVTDPDAIENTENMTLSGFSSLSELHNFTLIARDSDGDSWTMEIVHENDNELPGLSGSGYVVSVVDGDGDRRTCDMLDDTGGREYFWVNVSEGTFNGTDCPALDFGEDIGPTSELLFRNGNNINGTYRVLVNQTETNVRSTANYNASGSTERPPITDKAIYDGKILVEYEEQRMKYRTDARAFPEESDD